MKLPSKSTPYKGSVLALFPVILSLVKEKPIGVLELRKKLPDIELGDLIGTLDCLYALGKIDIDPPRGVLFYVNSDNM